MTINERIDAALELQSNGRIQEALDLYLSTLKDKEIDEPENYKKLSLCLIQVALIYRELKNYDEVIWYCHELIANNYAYKDPYILLADIYNEMNMPTLAIGCLKMAEEYGCIEDELIYTNCSALINDTYSVAYAKLGKIDLALEYIDKVLDADEDNVKALKLQRKLLKLSKTK